MLTASTKPAFDPTVLPRNNGRLGQALTGRLWPTAALRAMGFRSV